MQSQLQPGLLEKKGRKVETKGDVIHMRLNEGKKGRMSKTPGSGD